MKLTRVFAWIGVAAACIAVAIAEAPPITGVEAIGVTVSDLDRSVEFYTQVLHFQKEWETELSGADVEHLKGVFGVRLRVARLRLGSEEIELSEYLAPQGRPLPQDSRSNDLWFQHVAIRDQLGMPADPDGHVIEAVSSRQAQAFNVQGR